MSEYYVVYDAQNKCLPVFIGSRYETADYLHLSLKEVRSKAQKDMHATEDYTSKKKLVLWRFRDDPSEEG